MEMEISLELERCRFPLTWGDRDFLLDRVMEISLEIERDGDFF